MQKDGFAPEREPFARLCPFCYEKLGSVAYLQLKTKKVCQCSKCGRTIDKRNRCY